MASENCKPTAKCLGIATLVIVGLLFFYNFALKGASANFNLKWDKSDRLHVTVTNSDTFPYDEEVSAYFHIALTAKPKDGQEDLRIQSERIDIVPKEDQTDDSLTVVFGDMEDYLDGSVTVTYVRGKEGFASSTNKVPSKSNSQNKQSQEENTIQSAPLDTYDESPRIGNDSKPLSSET
eukprot:290216_1